jgi:hypothetical protein
MGRFKKLGIQQGNVLTPALFLRYVAGLKSKINQNFKLIEYTDDVAIYSINWHNKIGVSEVEKGVQ